MILHSKEEEAPQFNEDFMKIYNEDILLNKFSKINHNYRTSSKIIGNYKISKSTMKLTNFVTSRTCPILWNSVLDGTLKEIGSLTLFKAKVKEMLHSCDNELLFS